MTYVPPTTLHLGLPLPSPDAPSQREDVARIRQALEEIDAHLGANAVRPALAPEAPAGYWLNVGLPALTTAVGAVEISLDGVTFGAGPLTVPTGAVLHLRLRSADIDAAAHGETVTGGVVINGVVRTLAYLVDKEPDAITLPAATHTALGAMVGVGPVTLAGFNAPVRVWASSTTSELVEVAVNGGAWVAAASTPAFGVAAQSGDTLSVQHRTASTALAATSTTINVGARAAVFQTTNQDAGVQTPTIISPANGAAGIGQAAAVASSAFSVTNGLPETHASTDWQLSTSAVFATTVAHSLADATNKTSWITPNLTVSTTYYVRCRHRGSAGSASAWSAAASFTTAAAFAVGFAAITAYAASAASSGDKVLCDASHVYVIGAMLGAGVIVGKYARSDLTHVKTVRINMSTHPNYGPVYDACLADGWIYVVGKGGNGHFFILQIAAADLTLTVQRTWDTGNYQPYLGISVAQRAANRIVVSLQGYSRLVLNDLTAPGLSVVGGVTIDGPGDGSRNTTHHAMTADPATGTVYLFICWYNGTPVYVDGFVRLNADNMIDINQSMTYGLTFRATRAIYAGGCVWAVGGDGSSSYGHRIVRYAPSDGSWRYWGRDVQGSPNRHAIFDVTADGSNLLLAGVEADNRGAIWRASPSSLAVLDGMDLTPLRNPAFNGGTWRGGFPAVACADDAIFAVGTVATQGVNACPILFKASWLTVGAGALANHAGLSRSESQGMLAVSDQTISGGVGVAVALAPLGQPTADPGFTVTDVSADFTFMRSSW